MGNNLGRAEFLLNPIECLLVVNLPVKMDVLFGYFS